MRINKKSLLILLIFISVISLSSISAEDVNHYDNSDNYYNDIYFCETDFGSSDNVSFGELEDLKSSGETGFGSSGNVSFGELEDLKSAYSNDTLKSDDVYDVYFDSSNTDNGDGSKDNPYKYFNVNIAGKSAYFANGEYTLTSSNRLVSSVMTLTGESADGVIINCRSFSLNVTRTGSLFLNNLTIKNNGVVVSNRLTATDVNFINCRKSTDPSEHTLGGGVFGNNMDYIAYSGYVFYNPIIKLVNCDFINSAAGYGGSVYVNNGTLTVDNCRFIDSTSYGYGAGIALLNTYAVIDNALFNKCISADDLGGGIYGFNSTVNIGGSNFTNCNSTFGTVTILDGKLELRDSLFENNRVKFEGGALFSMYSPITVANCNFTGNSAINGGALFMDNSTSVSIRNSNFNYNDASGIGGAIFSNEISRFVNVNNNFNGNTAYKYNNFYNQSFWPMFYGGSNSTVIVNNKTYNLNGTYPSRYSLVDLGEVTSVKNQEYGGNCWAFATLAALESAILKANNQTYDFSEENMKNLAVLYSRYGMISDGYGKLLPNDGGFFDMSVGYLVGWMGPVLEELDKYCDYSYVSYLYPNSTSVHVQNVYYIPARQTALDNNNIKEALMRYGAVTVSMYYDSYYGESNYYCPYEAARNHAVTIVGWDDDYSASNFVNRPSGNGAFIVKNSWDTTWGDNGYFHVSYYDPNFCRIGTQDAVCFILNDSTKYNKNYQYDVGGKSDWMVTGRNNVWYKNIFNSTGNDYLTAFSTYFNSTSTDYTAYIYVNGQLMDTVSGSSPMGYYTIHLNKLVPLKTGDIFEVVININGTELGSFPVEEASTYRLHSVPGISLFSYNGVDWTDLYDYKSNMSQYGHYYSGHMVASIKAFTLKPDILNNVTVIGENFTGTTIGSTALTARVIDNTNGTSVNEGTVSFEIDGKNHTVPVNDGIAELDYNFTGSGNYTVYIYYNGGGMYSVNYTVIKGFIKRDSHIDISSDDISYGENLNIVAVVNDGLSTGNITVFVDSAEYKNYTLIDGKASFSIPGLSTGDRNITVRYNGDLYYMEGENSITVNVAHLNTTVDADYENITVGDDLILNIKIVHEDESIPPTGDVTVNINRESYKGKLNNGTVKIIVPNLRIGYYDTNIIYGGDEIYESATYNIKVNVARASTHIASEDFHQMAVDFYNGERGGYFIIKLTDNKGKVLRDKNISIGFNGVVYNRTTDENGSAGLQINLRYAGTYTFATAFLGDENCTGVFAVNSIHISKKTSRLILKGNSPVKVNTYRTLTISLQGQKALNTRQYVTAVNKTVKVTVNGKTYSVYIGANGKGTLKVRFTKAATYTVTTMFAGDGTYLAKTATSKITARK